MFHPLDRYEPIGLSIRRNAKAAIDVLALASMFLVVSVMSDRWLPESGAAASVGAKILSLFFWWRISVIAGVTFAVSCSMRERGSCADAPAAAIAASERTSAAVRRMALQITLAR